jgi:formylmethanofuran dehydrogenase subunit B
MAETVTCPFCGLACDDLALSETRLDTRGCARAAAGFARAAAPRKPHTVGGKPASRDAAVSAAALILQGASAPLIHGLAADLHGIRALLALAERIGGTVDHMYSPALLANAAVARASGWVAATFAEVANRADFILLVGGDPQRNFPRFHERLVRNATPLYRDGPPKLAYIGPESVAPLASPAALSAVVGEAELLNSVAALSLLTRGRRLGPAHGGLPVDVLAEIAGRLRNARYGVIAWELAIHVPLMAELVVEYLADLLRHLNARTRCVGLPLGGMGNSLGAMQAALWQLGWPLRVSFASGGPDHDPWRHDGDRILGAGEADAIVWVATSVAEPPPVSAAPMIALVTDDMEPPSPAAVEIRVGTAGVDHGGEIVRADAVIAVPLQAIRPSDRPSVAQVAREILAAVEERPC